MSDMQQDLQDEELDFLLMDKEQTSSDTPAEFSDPEGSENNRGPNGELKPTLHGDLTQVNLPDIFQSLVMSQMEGTLQVNSKWKVTYVHHEAGQIRILLPEEDWLKRIGYRLLSSGLVDGRDLKAALRRSHKEQQDLGQILMDDYGTDREQFLAIRKALEEDAIFELFTQHRGNFAFYGDAYPDPDLERRFATCPTFEASSILLEVARKSDEWTIILQEIEDINEIMRPTQDAYKEGVEVNEIEENLLNQLDGTRSLSDIAGGMLYSLFDVMKAAQTLLRRDLIEQVPTEDLFALTEADIHAEQEKRAVYYLKLVSTLRKPLPLNQLESLAELQIRVNRPRDAGKTFADCAALVDNEGTRLQFLYESKRLDPRNPDTLAGLLDALALHLSNPPAEQDGEGDRTLDRLSDGAEVRPIDEADIQPELALGGDPAETPEGTPAPPSEGAALEAHPTAPAKPIRGRHKQRSFEDKREDFRDLSLELADFLQHRDDPDGALEVIDRLISFDFRELKIPILKSKILCKLDRHSEAIQVLVDTAAGYKKEGRQKEQAHCLEQVLKLDPSNSKARNELRNLRSRFNRRVRRLLVAGLVLVCGGLGAWKYYEGMQLSERAQAMIEEATQKSRSPNEGQLAEALGLLSEVRRIAGDTGLGEKAQALTDRILAEKARRKQALIEKKEGEFDSLAKAARTSFLQGHFTKALHLYMAMATSKQHGKRSKFITELFLSQQENLASELDSEINRLSTQALPDVRDLRNREEYKAAQLELIRRFPMERRRKLHRFVETIRLGIVERHPFLAKKGTEPIPTLFATLFGHDKIPERYEAIQKSLSSDERLPEDLTSRIRSMDLQDLDRIADEASKAGLVSGMSLVQEAGLLASPSKTLYLDLLDYLREIRDILELDTARFEEANILKRLALALKSPPFSVSSRIESIEKEIGDLVARNKDLRIRRENRIKALGQALAISNNIKITPELRQRRLRGLGLAYDPRANTKKETDRAGKYLNDLLRALAQDEDNYERRMQTLHRIQSTREWANLEMEEMETGDAELLTLLADEKSERPVRAQRTRFALLVAHIQPAEDVRQAEVEERHESVQSFQMLLQELGEATSTVEDKLEACKEFQLRIEVLLLRDGGRIQEILEARRVGNAGLLGRYMALLAQVERIENQLNGKLSTNSSIIVINRYFLEAEKAFKDHRFQDSLENYEKLLIGYSRLSPEARDPGLLAQFEQDEIKLRDICERLTEIEMARQRNDHQTALDNYRYLDRFYPDVNFRQVVRLPILISSVPAGARIFVNGEPRGVTPETLAMPPSTELRIEILLKGFKTEAFDARTSEASRFIRDLEIEERWSRNYESAITTEPTIDERNHRVLLSDRRGVFRCLDLRTGKVIYTKSFSSLSGEYDVARIYGKHFLLASAEGILRRFETATGKEAAEAQDLGKSLRLPSRVLGNDILLTTKEGELLLLNPAYDHAPIPLIQLADLRFPPVTDGQNRIFAATSNGKVRAWDKEGRLLWEQKRSVEGCGWNQITLRGDYLLVPTDRHKIHCLDSQSGRHLWTASMADDLPFPPTMDEKRAFIATTGNELIILDLETGRRTGTKIHKLPARPSGPIALWGRYLMIPIRGKGIRFFDREMGTPAFRIGGKTTSEVSCGLIEDSFLFYSTKGDVRSYPMSAISGPATALPPK